MKKKPIITLLSMSLALASASGYTLPELHSEYADLAFVTTNTPSYFPTTNGLIELKHNVPFSREVDSSNTWDGVGTDILRWNVGTASGFLANMSGMIERTILMDVTDFEDYNLDTYKTNAYDYIKNYDVLHDILSGTDTNGVIHYNYYSRFKPVSTNFCDTLQYRISMDHLSTWLRIKDMFDFHVMGNNGSITNGYGGEHFYSRAGSTRFPFTRVRYEDTILPEGVNDNDYLDLFVDASYIWPVPIRFMNKFDTYGFVRDVIHTKNHADFPTTVGTDHCRLGELYNVFGQFLQNRKSKSEYGSEDYPWKVPSNQDIFWYGDSLTNAFSRSRLAYSNPGPVFATGALDRAMCSYHSKDTRLNYDRFATTAQLVSMIDRKYVADQPMMDGTNFSAVSTVTAFATNTADVAIVFYGSRLLPNGEVEYRYRYGDDQIRDLIFSETNEISLTANEATETRYNFFKGETTRTASASIAGHRLGETVPADLQRIDKTGRTVEVFMSLGGIGITYGGKSYVYNGGYSCDKRLGLSHPLGSLTLYPRQSGGSPIELAFSAEDPSACSGSAFVYRTTPSEFTRKYGTVHFGHIATNEYLVLENLGIVKSNTLSALISRCRADGEMECTDLNRYLNRDNKDDLEFYQDWEIRNSVYKGETRTDGSYSATSGFAMTNLNSTFDTELRDASDYVAESFPVKENYDGIRESNNDLVDHLVSSNDYCIVGTTESMKIFPFTVEDFGGLVKVSLFDYESEYSFEPFCTHFGDYNTYFSVGFWSVGLKEDQITTSGTPKRSYGRLGSANDLELKFKNLTTSEE